MASSPASLLEVSGHADFSLAGSLLWQPVTRGQSLGPGDRLRTHADSRATVQLSDRSVIRINELTVLEIRAPLGSGKKRFRLQKGSIFFLNRESPSDIELETPLVTGAIRGTEFLLSTADPDGTTTLALFEGLVEIAANGTNATLVSGQEAIVLPNQFPKISAALPLVGRIQWCFYYPAVLNPADLAFTSAEEAMLTPSLDAYRGGDLLRALDLLPAPPATLSGFARCYYAALKLAVGQVSAANSLIAPVSSTNRAASALQGLIAAVTGMSWSPPREPVTSSEWLAVSYYHQSQSRLPQALAAARQATTIAPDFGFAWERVAELEFGFERRTTAREALARARHLAPRHAEALALAGYIDLDESSPFHALRNFDDAIALDGALGSAWLGRGIALEQLASSGLPGNLTRRQFEDGRASIQMAAALEPQRALFRSYLGKAWSQSGDDRLAEKDFGLAMELDGSDPTAWLYSALHNHQLNRINEAIKGLEHSIELNDNRSVFRSRLRLDRDRAIRQAGLAAIYNDAGLVEVSQRTAERAVLDGYAESSAHLFLSQSLAAREDPGRFDLRLETPRLSELLVANLFAPPGGGNLSQVLSQQDHLQYFGLRPVGMTSYTEYRSHGDWIQAGSVFGTVDHLSYAIDGEYISANGQQPNGDYERHTYSAQMKQFLTPRDSLYAQVGYTRSESGDIARHYDPAFASRFFHSVEVQEPYLYLGYHREWSPYVHTLFLASRVPDRLSLTNPSAGPLFIHLSGGKPFTVERDHFFNESFHSDFTLHSAELQQVFASEDHSLVFGARGQAGAIDNDALLTRGPSGRISDQSLRGNLERASGYGYYQWQPFRWIQVLAGISYDHVSYPLNSDSPPLTEGSADRSRWSPKVALALDPWYGGHFRAAWAQSLGGFYFDNSVRLEPSQVAGFVNAYRSLLPESVAGLVPGTAFEIAGFGFDQRLASGTYFGITAELLTSDASRAVGAFTNATFVQTPDSISSTRESLDFEEHTLSAYVNQLFGRHWAAGARYQYTESEFTSRFPELPRTVSNLGGVEQDENSVLRHAQLYLLFNHESGFFAQWVSEWYGQQASGFIPAQSGADFWQHNAFAGFRFPRRHAELRFGVLNLTDKDYRLNPLNLHDEAARARTFVTSLRVNF